MDFRSGLRVLLLLLAALIVAVMLAFPATAYDLQQGDWNISPAYLGTIGFSVAATILFYFLCRKLWFWVYAIGLTLITASHVYVPYALWSRTRVDAQDGLVILLPWFTLFCCVTGAVVLLFIRQILQQVKQPSPSPVPNLSESPGTVSAADDQQRYINHASWGPLLGVLYFYRFGTKKILALYAIPAALWLLGFGLTVVEMALSFSGRAPLGYYSILTLVVSSIFLVTSLLIPISLIIAVFIGRRVAWSSRTWQSFDEFKQAQRPWNLWGKVVFGVLVGLVIVQNILASQFLPEYDTNRRGTMPQSSESAKTNTDEISSHSYFTYVYGAVDECHKDQIPTSYVGCDSMAELDPYLNMSGLDTTGIVLYSFDNGQHLFMYRDQQESCENGGSKYSTYNTKSRILGNTCYDKVPAPSVTPLPTTLKYGPTITPIPASDSHPANSSSFLVSQLLAKASLTSSGACYQNFSITATVNVNGPGTITYYWKDSEGKRFTAQQRQFDRAGSHDITVTWTTSEKNGEGEHWMQLVITQPNPISSNRASFTRQPC